MPGRSRRLPRRAALSRSDGAGPDRGPVQERVEARDPVRRDPARRVVDDVSRAGAGRARTSPEHRQPDDRPGRRELRGRARAGARRDRELLPDGDRRAGRDRVPHLGERHRDERDRRHAGAGATRDLRPPARRGVAARSVRPRALRRRAEPLQRAGQRGRSREHAARRAGAARADVLPAPRPGRGDRHRRRDRRARCGDRGSDARPLPRRPRRRGRGHPGRADAAARARRGRERGDRARARSRARSRRSWAFPRRTSRCRTAR